MNELVKFRQIVRDLVDRREWEEIYLLSSIIRREISILIDADDAIWIDVGDQSQVSLSPPYGSKLPFKLWVHTHPNMLAYWSATDQESLKMATNILDRAYVLVETAFCLHRVIWPPENVFQDLHGRKKASLLGINSERWGYEFSQRP